MESKGRNFVMVMNSSGRFRGGKQHLRRKGVEGSLFPSEILVADLIPDGCTVVEDVSPFNIRVKDLEIVSPLIEGESRIRGEEMRQRAVNLRANLGLVDATLILARQSRIPGKLRNYRLVCPGTLLQNPCGVLLIPILFWLKGCWYLSKIALADWDDRVHWLIRCKSV